MPQRKPIIDLNDASNRVIAAVALALVFIGGWWLIARNAAVGLPSNEKVSDSKAQIADAIGKSRPFASVPIFGRLSEETPTIAGDGEFVDVEDQDAGMSVRVKSAALAQAGWIAVRDAEGRTLGAGRFDAGEHANVEVPLLRATESGERYQALIYVDDGDREFSLQNDILVMRGDGSVAGDVFVAR